MTTDNTESKSLTKEDVIAVLKNVLDPDIQMNIVDLGLVYDVEVRGPEAVYIKMTLTTPACPYGPELIENAKTMLLMLKGVKHVEVDLVFVPPWSQERMSEEAKLELGLDL
jgi:metal-sulfur cluster biosynthetic enzyme